MLRGGLAASGKALQNFSKFVVHQKGGWLCAAPRVSHADPMTDGDSVSDAASACRPTARRNGTPWRSGGRHPHGVVDEEDLDTAMRKLKLRNE